MAPFISRIQHNRFSLCFPVCIELYLYAVRASAVLIISIFPNLCYINIGCFCFRLFVFDEDLLSITTYNRTVLWNNFSIIPRWDIEKIFSASFIPLRSSHLTKAIESSCP